MEIQNGLTGRILGEIEVLNLQHFHRVLPQDGRWLEDLFGAEESHWVLYHGDATTGGFKPTATRASFRFKA